VSGWFSIKRGALDHELMRPQGKFSRFEAWVWIIESAAYADTTIDLGGKPFTVKRGCLCFSERFLSAKWRWSRKAVTTFLGQLQAHGSIAISVAQNGAGTKSKRSHITVCNYERYQNGGAKTEPKGSQKGAKEEQDLPLAYARGAETAPVLSDTDLYRLGKQVLGKSAGGVITKLKAQEGIPRAIGILQQAAEKADPMEWIVAALKPKRTPHDEKLAAWGIGDAKPVRVEHGPADFDAFEATGATDVSRVQSHSEEPEGEVPFGDADLGWNSSALPSLRLVCGGAL
jgi:hypothetical protein